MTARDLLGAVLRRWYVVLLGGALTLGALMMVGRQEPVWWTQYNIVIVGPTGDHRTNVLDNPLYGLQPLVGVIATDFNDGHPPLLTGDVAATMVGEGEREGVQVRTPNLGTQWRPLFSANYLDVQVAGPDPDQVLATAQETTLRVSALLEEHQDELHVPPTLRARAVPSSGEPTVVPIAGSRSRAGAATLMTGGFLTLVAVYWVERWRGRRSPGTVPHRSGRARRSLRRGRPAEVRA